MNILSEEWGPSYNTILKLYLNNIELVIIIKQLQRYLLKNRKNKEINAYKNLS